MIFCKHGWSLKQLRSDLQTHENYIRFNRPNERVLGRRDLIAAFEEHSSVAATLDRLILKGTLIKHDATSTVAKTCIDDKPIVIKRYNKKGLVHCIKMLLTKTRAEKSFLKALLLRKLQIPTPEPLAYCVVKRWGIATTSYILAACSRGETLCDLFDNGQLTEDEWTLALHKTGEIINHLHANRITHGDIKTPNLLFDRSTVEIIDLDPLKLHHLAARFKRFRNKDLNAFAQRVKSYPQRDRVK